VPDERISSTSILETASLNGRRQRTSAREHHAAQVISRLRDNFGGSVCQKDQQKCRKAEIAVHRQEENYVDPPERFVAQANLTDKTEIMRRVLAAISNNEDAGDVSTLANPEIVDNIRKVKS
jgi:hypothetical protein